MGGGGQSEQIVSKTNLEAIGVSQTVITNLEEKCDLTNKGSNILQIVGSRIKNLNTSQKNSLQAFCKLQAVLKNETNADITNKIMDQLKSDAQVKGEMLTAGAKSNIKQNVLNQTLVNVNQTALNNTIQKCIGEQDMENIMQIVGSDVSDSNLSQVNDSIYSCILGSDAVQSALAKSDTESKTEMDTKAKVESTQGSMFAISGAVACCWFILLSVVLYFVYYSLGGQGGGQDIAKTALVM